MILARDVEGVAFGTRADGDPRRDVAARRRIASSLGIDASWATVQQVHGARVVVASSAGHLGEADAIVTDVPGLPLAIGTADCVPVVIIGRTTRGIAHAGWRGLAAGVIEATVEAMAVLDDRPVAAVVGPHIGPCCYEVGDEVPTSIGVQPVHTRSGTQSVDLGAAVAARLQGIPVEMVGGCTYDDPDMASFRENATSDRQVTVAWVPKD